MRSTISNEQSSTAGGLEGAVDRRSHEPAYLQICNILKGQITRGAYLPGSRLPSEDVSKHQFMAAIEDLNPDIVGFSCMITSGLEARRATIAHLRAGIPSHQTPRAYLAGGRRMDRNNGEKVGADRWAAEVMEGVRLCQQVLAR